MSAAAGLAAASLVLVLAWRCHALRVAPASRGVAPSRPSRPSRRLDPTAVGRAVERLGRPLRRVAHRPADRTLDRRAGRTAIVFGVALASGGPIAAVTLALVTWCVPLVRARGARRRQATEILDRVPEVVDLFRLATAAGLNVRLACDAVARHGDGVITEGIRGVSRRAARGDRLADALTDLAPLGEPVRPLLDALLSTERYGTPLGPALDRVADDGRRQRRRVHEEAARRIPVKLLFPLVFCTLPALGLLTVVPIVVRSWPALVP